MDDNTKRLMIETFNSGVSMADIAVRFGTTRSNVYQVVSSSFPCVAPNDESIINEICELYTVGVSSTFIAEKMRINHKAVNKVLDTHGIKRTGVGRRKYSLNENYFDNIDTQDKAYILGLFYADGYNGVDRGTIRIQLSESDRRLLEQINTAFESNHPINTIDCSERVYGNGYVSKNMCGLDVYSAHMCKTLCRLGAPQNKSLVLRYPSFLPLHLQNHFLRGYFDGDGSITVGKKTGLWVFTLTSTEAFCNGALDTLRRNTGIGGGVYDASCHNGITKVLSIGGKNQCQTVMDWLYDGANLYLERKHQRYTDYCNSYLRVSA